MTAAAFTHRMIRTVTAADGQVRSRFERTRSKAAATRKISWAKQFDAEDVRAGCVVTYDIREEA